LLATPVVGRQPRFCDGARAQGQSRPSKRFLRLGHPRRDLRLGLRRFSNPRRRNSFRDRNCRMGPLLCLPFTDRLPRILQLLAFGDPARSGGNRKTPGEFRMGWGPKVGAATIGGVSLLLVANDRSPERRPIDHNGAHGIAEIDDTVMGSPVQCELSPSNTDLLVMFLG